MTKIIIIASGKGGTGKTTVVANLGATLAMDGNKTVVIDMDLRWQGGNRRFSS